MSQRSHSPFPAGVGLRPDHPISPHGYNTGRWMSAPLQSHYASIRQRLIANPGASKKLLLEGYCAETNSTATPLTYSSLEAAQPTRHCPQCAESLYHSALYEFPWLVHCPMHQEPLIANCPLCEQPWPSIHELSERRCPTCGIPGWEQLANAPRLNPGGTESIARLAAFVNASSDPFQFTQPPPPVVDCAGGHLWDAPSLYRWPQAVAQDTKLYPAFQRKFAPGSTEKALQQLGVSVPHFTLERLRTRLRRYTLKPPNHDTWSAHLSRTGPIRRPTSRALKVIQSSLIRVLAWIETHSGPGHQLRLGEYRGLIGDDLQDRDQYPCPFCLAFSCWWDAITQKYFAPSRCVDPRTYFPAISRFDCEWPNASDRHLVMDENERFYRPEPAFESCFFERSLMILFARQYSLAQLQALRLTASSHRAFDPTDQQLGQCKRTSTASYLLAAFTAPRELTVYWPKIDPLDEIQVISPPSEGRLCGIDTQSLGPEGPDSPNQHLTWNPKRVRRITHDPFRRLFMGIGEELHSTFWAVNSGRLRWARLDTTPGVFVGPNYRSWH